MKKFIKSKLVLQIFIASLVATFATAGIVAAATTIGANVTTTGTLSATGNTTLGGTLAVTGNSSVNGYATTTAANGNFATAGTLTVTGASTFTASTTHSQGIVLSNGETIENYTNGIVNLNGHFKTTAVRLSDTTGYENFLEVAGEVTTTAASAKSRGIYVDLNRPATAVLTGGDIDDSGIMVRVGNRSANLVTGPVLRGIDVQAKNRSTGTITNVYGGAISTQTDSGGTASTSKALELSMTINGTVQSELTTLDVRMFRQAATEPTTERIVWIRNSNTSGTGVDAGIWFTSENDWSSNATTTFDYLIDGNDARVNTADIRLSNGETIANTTDGIIALGGGNVTIPANYSLDTAVAGTLNIGTSTANAITIGAADITTTIAGLTSMTNASSTLANFGAGTTVSGLLFGTCTVAMGNVTASSTAVADCTATGVTTDYQVFVTPYITEPEIIFSSASSTVAGDVIQVAVYNTGAKTGTIDPADNIWSWIAIK